MSIRVGRRWFRRARTGPVVARVRAGADAEATWEVAVGERPLAVFPRGERLGALDFANGFNLGARWKP